MNEKLINEININLNSYSGNEANTNTEYGTTQVLSSNLSFANPNNDSISASSITPQTPLKDSDTPATKSIPDYWFRNSNEENNRKCGNKFFRKKHRHNDTI